MIRVSETVNMTLDRDFQGTGHTQMFWMWEEDDIYDFFSKLKKIKNIIVHEILNSGLDYNDNIIKVGMITGIGEQNVRPWDNWSLS